MLGIFRGFLKSRVGVIITFVALGVIALAFGLSDINGSRGALSSSSGGDTLVTVGKQTITADDAKTDTQRLYDQNRQQYPQLQMAEFIAKGGFDQPLAQKINALALVSFADSLGIRVGKSLIDSEITQIPAFRGLDGKFDKNAYLQVLQQQRLTDRDVHDQLGRDLTARLVIGPLVPQSLGTTPVAANFATPYASMLLEKRTGTIAFISTRAIPQGAPVTDAEAKDYYARNIARYTVPERRVVKYAEVTFAGTQAKSAPSDAEVAQAYTAQKDKFAPSETRDIRQVVVADKAGADALAAKVKAGTAIDAAAKAIGLDAATLTAQTKTAYATQTSSAVADQVFAAADGAILGPIQTPLGWAVVRVDKITHVPGKSLDQAKPELVKTLSAQKAVVAINDLHEKISDLIAKNTPIEDIARQLGLSLATTPAVDPQGNDPTAATPPAKPDQKLAGLAALGFASQPDADPQMVPSAQDGSFILAKLDKVIPATPKPLAEVAEQVKKDFIIDRQVRDGRIVAQDVTDKVNKGMPLAQALAETKLSLDGTKPLTGNRAQLLTAQRAPQPLILLFSMPVHTAKMLQAPYKGGWFVVVADSFTRGDARSQPAVIEKMRGDLARALGDEYSQQFVRAVRDQVGVKRNDAAIAKVRASLVGANGDASGQ
ncbi:MAG: SurA N-terminal domain-containing protein [Sphingomonas sp.]|uniref:peptidylprolyl isomerase n=1 Tax=Sphingomonas sp. TaxID=28214 RepID=UPI001AC9C3C4|nr:peptidylprolyl isomerase [Sphingomonas sp.]MBN8807229.1 SurA N-terminal domain-containing protein [Sphingomonas sp.]